MPKATKLHPKGKTSTIQKPCKKEKDGTDNADPEESIRQFQLELCWCIQQCERFLREKKGTEKQMQETWKVLAVLKNNNQPMIRKRQLMRSHLGDYRSKMALEEKKLAKMASKMKISETPDKPKATFVRKSAFLTTGDNSFRFNFNLAPQDIDDPSTSSVTEDKTVPDDSNWKASKHLEVSNTEIIGDGNTDQKLASSTGNSDGNNADNEQKSETSTASKIKISETPDKLKAITKRFVRKTAFFKTGDNFRFNFNLAPQDIDDPSTSSATDDETVADDGNSKHLKVSNTGEGNTDHKLTSSSANSDGNHANNNEQKSETTNNLKHFKFCLSESQFNFNVNE